MDLAIQINPIHSKSYSNKGMNSNIELKGNAFYALRKYKDALLMYEKAIQLNPNDTDAYVNKGINIINIYKGNALRKLKK